MRTILKLVIHCSATPDAMDVGFTEINEWHLDHGWAGLSGVGCGYHYLIRRSGVVEVGRMAAEKGAHVKGQNHDSIGICLVGTHEFSMTQFDSLKRVLDGLMQEFPEATVHEHNEFPSAKAQGKSCPNFQVKKTLGIK